MLKLRWVLLCLYIALLAGLVVLLWHPARDECIVVIPVIVVFQILFFVLRGNPQSLQPCRPREVLFPVIVSALMVSVLAGTMIVAVAELLEFSGSGPGGAFLVTLLAVWSLWLLLFFTMTCWVDYLRAVKRLVLAVMMGSLLQLLVTIPSHIIVSRRPGCMVGRWTAMGISGGLCVLLWVFGPGIVLLFLYEARKRRAGHCPDCGYDLRGLPELRCPECGRRFSLKEVRMAEEQLQLKEPESTAIREPQIIWCPRCRFGNVRQDHACAECGALLDGPGSSDVVSWHGLSRGEDGR